MTEQKQLLNLLLTLCLATYNKSALSKLKVWGLNGELDGNLEAEASGIAGRED